MLCQLALSTIPSNKWGESRKPGGRTSKVGCKLVGRYWTSVDYWARRLRKISIKPVSWGESMVTNWHDVARPLLSSLLLDHMWQAEQLDQATMSPPHRVRVRSQALTALPSSHWCTLQPPHNLKTENRRNCFFSLVKGPKFTLWAILIMCKKCATLYVTDIWTVIIWVSNGENLIFVRFIRQMHPCKGRRVVIWLFDQMPEIGSESDSLHSHILVDLNMYSRIVAQL